MSIFEKLYKGELCPVESCVPHTDEYRKAAHRLSEASYALEKVLNDNQKSLYEAYQAAKADAEILVHIEIYRQGTLLGLELSKELTTEKTDNRDRILESKNE